MYVYYTRSLRLFVRAMHEFNKPTAEVLYSASDVHAIQIRFLYDYQRLLFLLLCSTASCGPYRLFKNFVCEYQKLSVLALFHSTWMLLL